MNKPTRPGVRSDQRQRGAGQPQGRGPRWATRRVLLGLAFAAVTTLGWFLERDARGPQEPGSGAPTAQSSASRPTGGTTDQAASNTSPRAADPATSAAPSAAKTYTGTVTQVADGDTVRFRSGANELRIRLDSIDAPEQDGGQGRPGQAFAQASRKHLQSWLQNRTVTAHCFEIDQYKRSVCDLIDGKGESASQAQVRAGYAWAYTAARGRYLRDPALVGMQAQAKQAGLGLWQNEGAVAPWVWRYDCWRGQQCAP